MLQRLQRKRADPCAMVRAWFAACLVARVGASGAAASYLTQRLADFGLEMGDFPGTGRGVRTVRKRARGERVVAWYDAEVVFAERALERRPELAAAAARAAALERPLTDEAVLALYICAEAAEGRDDWFLLYRSTLPAAQPSAVTGGDAYARGLPRCYAACCGAVARHALSRYDDCEAALGAAAPGAEAFLRALAHVRARSFALDDDVFKIKEARSGDVAQRSGTTRKALLPLLDLLNHRDGTRVRLERSPKSWRLVALEDYGEGAEVFNDYGDRPNLDLFLHYGFALRDATHARASFDAADLAAACAAARPDVFGGRDARASLERRLAADEAARRAAPVLDLALYSVDLPAGAEPVAPSGRLRDALAVLAATAAGLGDAAASKLPGDVVDALLRARLAELAGLSGGGGDGPAAALVAAERAALEGALGVDR